MNYCRVNILFLCLCFSFQIPAQVISKYTPDLIADTSKNYGYFAYFQIRGHRGFQTPPSDKNLLEILFDKDYWALDARLGFQTTGRFEWEQADNYPQFGLGFNFSHFEDSTVVEKQGQPLSLYAFAGIPLIRSKGGKFYFNFEVAAGLAYQLQPYDQGIDPHVLINFRRIQAFYNFALSANHQIGPRLDFNYALNLIHYSNGRIRAPNNALDLMGFDLGLKWYFNPMQSYIQTVNPDRKLPVRPKFQTQAPSEYLPFSYYNFWFGPGVISTTEFRLNGGTEPFEAEGPSYFAGSVGLEWQRHWRPSFSAGMVLSAQYDASLVEFYENEGFESGFSDRFTLSSGPIFEYFIERFSLFGQFAIYIYSNPIYRESRSFWHFRAGSRLRITKNIFAHLAVKTQNGLVADWVEWGFGYSFLKRRP